MFIQNNIQEIFIYTPSVSYSISNAYLEMHKDIFPIYICNRQQIRDIVSVMWCGKNDLYKKNIFGRKSHKVEKHKVKISQECLSTNEEERTNVTRIFQREQNISSGFILEKGNPDMYYQSTQYKTPVPYQ